MAGNDRPRVLKDLIPVYCTRSTAQEWYTTHKSSEDCGCIHESAGRWRIYWKTQYLEGGNSVVRTSLGRTKEWERAKLLHEWGIDVNDDPGKGGSRRDDEIYGAWDGQTTRHRKYIHRNCFESIHHLTWDSERSLAELHQSYLGYEWDRIQTTSCSCSSLLNSSGEVRTFVASMVASGLLII